MSNVNEIIYNAVNHHTEQLNIYSIQLETSLEINLPLTYMIPENLGHVFINLIRNSIDALKDLKSEKKIIIKTYSETNIICIEFKDTGIGINDNDRDKIFLPFYTTKKDTGSGIGLWMCKQIIEEELSGTIELKSSINSGAEFLIQISIVLEKKDELSI